MGFRDWVMEGNRSDRTFAQEMRKQFLVDQPLHCLWGIATMMMPFIGFGVFRQFGILAACAGCAVGLALAGLSNWYWRHRESKQAEDGSHWRFDRPLDEFFFYAGQLAGIWPGLILLTLLAVPGAA